MLTPIIYRWVASGGATSPSVAAKAVEYWWNDLTDPDQTDDDLNAKIAAGGFEDYGTLAVTDFTGTFELRRLQWRWSRAPSGGTSEDQDVCSFHFIKATGGTPGTYVDGTDLPAVETALNTYWGSVKVNHPTWMHSDQYRWYKDGPAFYVLNSAGTAYVPIPTGNPAIRITEVDVVGTGVGTPQPPQSASTVTERTSTRAHWGRFYLPSMTSSQLDADGRLTSAVLSSTLAATVTFYNACRTAGMVPVVFSMAKPARKKKNGTDLPAVGAVAYEVTSLQMDNLYDVIRSRRYRAATVKTNTALT